MLILIFQSYQEDNLKQNIKDLNLEELEKIFVEDLNEKQFRAKQVFKWIYKNISSYKV